MPKIDREKVLSRLPSLVRFRLTSQRLLLLSLSTVYRALRLFKELGIVDDLHYEEHHYHALKLPREHYHLVCLGCGYVVEFETALVDALKESVGLRHGFEVARAEVNLSGLCGRCR